VLLLRDVTAEKGVEAQLRQQERLAAVGELAAGVAHDFNNILQSVLLFSDLLLKQGDLSSPHDEAVRSIIQQGERGAGLIRQILDFSRRSVHRKQPLDLRPFLEEEARLLRQTIPENICVTLEVEPDEFWTVADAAQIQQVVANLAINARDAMANGGNLRLALERITVAPEGPAPMPEMRPGPYLKLSVEDTGGGIPESARSHIFDPFFTTKRPGEGTGLGLSQVYGIVKAHGGHIGVASEEGRGTLFRIYLPEAAAGAREEPEPVPEGSFDGEGQTILVVEDNLEILQTARECLRSAGYSVLTAVDGEEALTTFQKHRDDIALVLSDVVMPRVGGVALAKALRAAAPEVPVVLISGYPLSEIEVQLREEGVSTWVQKPFSAAYLTRAVGSALSGAAQGPS
jgi:nitrogen-specific signal transduction histidine kinase/ActR/RegA family two-component response regulator